MNSDNQNSPVTKRSFLQTLGMIGGSAAVMTALNGWEISKASTKAAPPTLSSDGNGKKIIILGAGISGMVTALELSKKGYDCQILEAREFAGGRCQSARKGTVIEEIGGEKQICNFEHDQYLNIGPWRIPAEHKSTLHYCRTLGVKLEVMINECVQIYNYTENGSGPLNGQRIRNIDLKTDLQGNITELLAKCANDGALEQYLTPEDTELLVEKLVGSGLIDKESLEYKPNEGRGYRDYPGAGEHFGALSEPYNLSEILRVKLRTQGSTADHPAVMYQAVGGMDQIAKAIFGALPAQMIKFNSEVTDIIQNDDGVEISYIDANTNQKTKTKADYCVSSIPFPVINKVNNNFDPEITDALKSPSAMSTVKTGVQMNRRFWEDDDMIYGGVAWSDIPMQMMMSYPSADLFGADGGVILANYVLFAPAVQFSNLSIAERTEFALSVGEKFHPGAYRKHFTGNFISKAWHKTKYSLGGWSSWSARMRTNKFPRLVKGDKRVFITGDSMAPMLTGWMAGAIESAWLTIEEIDKRVGQASQS